MDFEKDYENSFMEFNSIKEIERFYDEETNTYYFIDNGEYIELIKFNFDLKVKADINALNIQGHNIDAINIVATDMNVDNINALDIKASDINANDIKAHNINARNIDANNINTDRIANANTITCKTLVCRQQCYVKYGIKCK